MDHLKNLGKLGEVIAKDAASTKQKSLIDLTATFKTKLALLEKAKSATAALVIVRPLMKSITDGLASEGYKTLVSRFLRPKKGKKKDVASQLPIELSDLVKGLSVWQLVIFSNLKGSSGTNKEIERSVLWVDDHPENNKKEAATMQSKHHVKVVQEVSSKNAKKYLENNPSLKTQPPSVFRIITDRYREGEGERAGAKLVSYLRKNGYDTVVCVYCGEVLDGLEIMVEHERVTVASSDALLNYFVSSMLNKGTNYEDGEEEEEEEEGESSTKGKSEGTEDAEESDEGKGKAKETKKEESDDEAEESDEKDAKSKGKKASVERKKLETDDSESEQEGTTTTTTTTTSSDGPPEREDSFLPIEDKENKEDDIEEDEPTQSEEVYQEEKKEKAKKDNEDKQKEEEAEKLRIEKEEQEEADRKQKEKAKKEEERLKLKKEEEEREKKARIEAEQKETEKREAEEKERQEEEERQKEESRKAAEKKEAKRKEEERKEAERLEAERKAAKRKAEQDEEERRVAAKKLAEVKSKQKKEEDSKVRRLSSGLFSNSSSSLVKGGPAHKQWTADTAAASIVPGAVTTFYLRHSSPKSASADNPGFDLLIVPPKGFSLNGFVFPVKVGVFGVRFFPVFGGEYKVGVKLDGENVGNCPFVLTSEIAKNDDEDEDLLDMIDKSSELDRSSDISTSGADTSADIKFSTPKQNKTPNNNNYKPNNVKKASTILSPFSFVDNLKRTSSGGETDESFGSKKEDDEEEEANKSNTSGYEPTLALESESDTSFEANKKEDEPKADKALEPTQLLDESAGGDTEEDTDGEHSATETPVKRKRDTESGFRSDASTEPDTDSSDAEKSAKKKKKVAKTDDLATIPY